MKKDRLDCWTDVTPIVKMGVTALYNKERVKYRPWINEWMGIDLLNSNYVKKVL